MEDNINEFNKVSCSLKRQGGDTTAKMTRQKSKLSKYGINSLRNNRNSLESDKAIRGKLLTTKNNNAVLAKLLQKTRAELTQEKDKNFVLQTQCQQWKHRAMHLQAELTNLGPLFDEIKSGMATSASGLEKVEKALSNKVHLRLENDQNTNVSNISSSSADLKKAKFAAQFGRLNGDLCSLNNGSLFDNRNDQNVQLETCVEEDNESAVKGIQTIAELIPFRRVESKRPSLPSISEGAESPRRSIRPMPIKDLVHFYGVKHSEQLSKDATLVKNFQKPTNVNDENTDTITHLANKSSFITHRRGGSTKSMEESTESNVNRRMTFVIRSANADASATNEVLEKETVESKKLEQSGCSVMEDAQDMHASETNKNKANILSKTDSTTTKYPTKTPSRVEKASSDHLVATNSSHYSVENLESTRQMKLADSDRSDEATDRSSLCSVSVVDDQQQESGACRGRRRANTVSYKEPSLSKKLRRPQ